MVTISCHVIMKKGRYKKLNFLEIFPIKERFLLRPFMQDQQFNISVTLMFLKKKKTLRSIDFLLPAAHWEAFPPVHTG